MTEHDRRTFPRETAPPLPGSRLRGLPGSDFPQSAERGCGASGKEAARDSPGQPARDDPNARRSKVFAFRMPQQDEYVLTIGVPMESPYVFYVDLTADEASAFLAEVEGNLRLGDEIGEVGDASR